ncbi:alginate biosynthesis transcriptional regulatory protein AlgB [Oxobacter pfennigii]|uniref:Alginate biosynthesis transcriptional regulatory protein AlgB n=1 Tax=Oxobacter pfennigii TaxID=36849 RepID=A0A0P8Z0M7_9CLOT|nr:sigma 54-interacting transcriptional regulator [Oxobacter pfennigii]KPU45706.1 alginate biosynthesis transcriptional regulatory protein AlgB [Oxobacter pfennigii]
MLLAEIKNDAIKFAEVISKILEVDVLIVDNNLKTISNTYHYPDKPMTIHRMSIIGQVITSGNTITIDDKDDYATCRECSDFMKCDMKGFICVPIRYKGAVVGAIALIVPEHKIPHVFSNVNNSIEFLERMADLLSSKIQNSDDYNNLNLIKREREVIMDSIDYAMVSMDELGYITYYNKRFKQYFGENIDCFGMFIRDVIPHKYLTEFLSNYIEFSDRLIYFEKDSRPFYGFLSCMNIDINGSRGGMLFIFKSISDVNIQLNEIGYSNTRMTFKFLEGGLIPEQVIEEAKRLSVTSKTVLISGETGAGEELLAKAMHTFSDRVNNCFITVNCDGTYRELLEESLFGDDRSLHVVGGLGKLQLAHKGTIYFYKIDQMPIYLQRRLVEVLKTGTIYRAGMHGIKVDVRMIFSTSSDLAGLVRNGLFDDELYYRISENTIYIPPLRQDKESLCQLIDSSARFYKEKYDKKSLSFDIQAMDVLLNYSWPGNRNELEKVMDNIVYRCTGQVTSGDLAQFNLMDERESAIKLSLIRDLEKESIAALLASNINKDEVAKTLGISRATLYRKIKKYNL